MIRLSQLLGQPAVSLDAAQRVGKVDGVLVRGDRVTAVRIGQELVPADAIPSFEGDTLTFRAGAPMEGTDPDAAGDPRGRLVLTEAGDGWGRLVDLELDERGTVEAVQLDDRTVPGTRLRAVGSYAVIVAERGAALPPPVPSTVVR